MNWGFLGAALARAVFAGQKARVKGPSFLTYSEEGRSGHIHYSRDGKRFSMYYEFGGGDALVCVAVPLKKDWVAQTGIALEHRDGVLDSIARQVVADRTSGGKRHEVSEGWITIFE